MARVKKCRYGKLKSPKGRRVCRKAPRKGRKVKSKKACRYGKLKKPIGKRICRKRRGRK